MKRKHNAPRTLREAVKAIAEHRQRRPSRGGDCRTRRNRSDEEHLDWDDWETIEIVVRTPLEDNDAKAPYSSRGRTPAVLAILSRYGFTTEKDLTRVHPCFEMAVRKRASTGTAGKLLSVAQLAERIRNDHNFQEKHSGFDDEALVKGCLDASESLDYFWSFCSGGLEGTDGSMTDAGCWHCRKCKKCVRSDEWHCKGCNQCNDSLSFPCERCQPELYADRMQC